MLKMNGFTNIFCDKSRIFLDQKIDQWNVKPERIHSSAVLKEHSTVYDFSRLFALNYK